MTSFADIIRPSYNKSLAITFDILAVLTGSLFLALMAQFSVYLWFSPVPITLQFLGVLLVGALLGRKRAALTVIAYLVEGSLGLPFFAAGRGGIAVLLSPTGGYLVGFVLAAYLAGLLLERGWRESYLLTIAAFIIAALSVWMLGAFWLSFYVGSHKALELGVYPFILGDLAKIILAAGMVPSAWRAFKRFQ